MELKKNKLNMDCLSLQFSNILCGGFLSAHRDLAAIKSAKELGINLYYNCCY